MKIYKSLFQLTGPLDGKAIKSVLPYLSLRSEASFQEERSPQTPACWHLVLDIQPPELGENGRLPFKPPQQPTPAPMRKRSRPPCHRHLTKPGAGLRAAGGEACPLLRQNTRVSVSLSAEVNPGCGEPPACGSCHRDSARPAFPAGRTLCTNTNRALSLSGGFASGQPSGSVYQLHRRQTGLLVLQRVTEGGAS